MRQSGFDPSERIHPPSKYSWQLSRSRWQGYVVTRWLFSLFGT